MSCSNLLSICRHDCLLLLHAKVCSEICREFSTRCTFWAVGRDNILRKTNSVTLVATFYVHTSQFNLILHRVFWGRFLPNVGGWGGWFPNKIQTPLITPKIAFFDPNFTFRSTNSHKKTGVGGWVNRFGGDLLKKRFLFLKRGGYLIWHFFNFVENFGTLPHILLASDNSTSPSRLRWQIVVFVGILIFQ